MIKTLLCNEHNQFLVVEDPSAISDIVQHKNRHLWIDMERPTPAEFQMIQEEFNLHPLAIEDAMARHQRPKIDQYETFYLVVFYAVDRVEENKSSLRSASFLKPTGAGDNTTATNTGPDDMQPALAEGLPLGSAQNGVEERLALREITMFMGENYLITSHYYPIAELDEVARRWKRNVEVIAGHSEDEPSNVPGARPLNAEEKQNLKTRLHDAQGKTLQPTDNKPTVSKPLLPTEQGKGKPEVDSGRGAQEDVNDIGILLYSLLDTIVDSYFPVIDGVVERVENLEEEIFEKYNQAAIESIFALKKDLLALRKVLAPERDVLNVLTRRDIPIFEPHTLIYFQDIYDHIVRITDSIDTYRDLLSSALDSYLSMQSNRLNITVQTLTSVSIMLMSISAITGWYGMNFQNMPELGTRYGYFVVIGVVAVVVILEWMFFRRKGWL